MLFRTDNGSDQQLFGGNAVQSQPSNDPTREAATNLELASLATVAYQTAARFKHGLTGDDVASKVKATPVGQSNVVSIVATDSDPGLAAKLANEFAKQFIAFRRAADQSKLLETQKLVERELSRLSPGQRDGQRGRQLATRADELRILASLQTGNAELVQSARLPGSPASPRPVKSGIVGVFLGLLVAIGVALGLERLDRRLKDPEEIEETFQRPVLGAIPQSRILAKRESTSGEPSDPMIALEQRENEAFLMLRANLRYFNVGTDVKSVLVTSAAPGDGKSTVSRNLAATAAATGSRVLLVEADLRHPTIGPLLGLSRSRGLSNLLSGQSTRSEVITRVAVEQRRNGSEPAHMDVIPSGPVPPNPTDLIDSEEMRELLRSAEHDYDLVVVDTPPTSVVSDAIPLLTEVTGVIIVARLGKSRRDAAQHLHRQLQNLKAPTLGIVINAVRATSGSYYGYGYGYGYSASDNGHAAVRDPA